MRGWAPFLAGIVLAAAVCGCQSTPPAPTGAVGPTGQAAQAPPSPLADASDCGRRIKAMVLTDSATVDAVDECRFIKGGADAASEILRTGGTRDQLWAAVWVYGSSAGDPAPLRPMINNSDATVRVMAAAALARLGDGSGLDTLGAALTDTDNLAGAYPPTLISEFAAASLSRMVDGPDVPGGPASAADITSLAGAWQSWLGTHRATLTYDASKGEWAAP